MPPSELATVAAEDSADPAVRLDRESNRVEVGADDGADPAVAHDSESLESAAPGGSSESPIAIHPPSRLAPADDSPYSEESFPNLRRIRLSGVELAFVKLPSESAVD